MAKTPSPKVIASMWLLDHLNTDNFTGDDTNVKSLSPESLTNLCDSRVNDAKVEKVVEQIDKIVLKLKERLEKVVAKFEAPPAKPSGKASPKKGPPPKGKASAKPKPDDDEDDEDDDKGRYDEDEDEDEDEAPPPKKKKKKK